MAKIGSSHAESEPDQAEPEMTPWQKFTVVMVDNNADRWFADYGPAPVSEVFKNKLQEIEKLSGVISFAAFSDINVVPSFEVAESDKGKIQDLTESPMGVAMQAAVAESGSAMNFKTVALQAHQEMVAIDNNERLEGIWETQGGTPFHQSFEVFTDSNGEETGYWFVDLLVTPVDFESFNEFFVGGDEGDTHHLILNTDNGGWSVGQLLTKLHIPMLVKQLAYMCETPFPSTQSFSLSRDIAFANTPESARPVPFFTIHKNGEAVGFSGSQGIHLAGLFPSTVRFGWRINSESLDHLDEILPLLVNGSSFAMSIVEDGAENYRDENYPAPWDTFVGSACAQLLEYEHGGSRCGAPQWIPTTHIGDLLVTTEDNYGEQVRLESIGEVDQARGVLAEIATTGLGPYLNHGINTLIYSYFLPELKDDPSVISQVEYYAGQVIRQEMAGQSLNALTNLGSAYYLIGDYEKGAEALGRVLQSEEEGSQAEASYVMALLEKARGNDASASAYMARSQAAGGFENAELFGESNIPFDPTSNNQPADSSYPPGWANVFEFLTEGSELRETIANFGSKYRLAGRLSSTAFDGDTSSSDAYYVLLKLSLLYSAIEAWEKLIGKGVFQAPAPEIAQELSDRKSFISFGDKISSVLTSKPLRAQLDALFQGSSQDVVPLLEAIRHGFFHPHLTANNTSLASNAELRKLLLGAYPVASEALSRSFQQWAQAARSWADFEAIGDENLKLEAGSLNVVAGYPRSGLDVQLGKALTDEQWATLVDKLWCLDDSGSVEDAIHEALEGFR